jgi:hypothetical protein
MFSHDIFNAYGLIETHTKQLTKQLQSWEMYYSQSIYLCA